MIKAILFDFDGVLTTDPTGGHTTCANLHKITNVNFETLRACYKKFNGDLNLGKTTYNEILGDFCACIGTEVGMEAFKEAATEIPLNAEMFALARSLREKYKTGIITNNQKEKIEILREKIGLREKFDAVVVSSEVGFGKNSRELFENALTGLGVDAKESVFIDNQEKNLVVPKQMGMKTIFYDDGKNDIGLLKRKLKGFGLEF